MLQVEKHTVKNILRTVKLVIWDLDGTFWDGTLSEGKVVPISANIELVRTLAQRGIISSVCSRNNHADAARELKNQGIWDYFVFPQIEWSAKGPLVQRIIELAQLRPENVLFIDDEPFNRAEVEHYSPGVMCLGSDFEQHQLLDNHFLTGSRDHELVRLQQYRMLERKQLDRSATNLSNHDFLRSSNIQIRISYQVDECIDRITELVNRSVQLNFTKRPLSSNEDIADFKRVLRSYGFKIGVVFARDNYGDYGIIGFFMYHVQNHELVHFVFSCRVMNMGIEQYVYESLGSPKISVVPPTANEICAFESVNWISEEIETRSLKKLRNTRSLLLGGCEMLQVASYLSENCVEFTNRARDGMTIVYDDPYFVLSNPHLIRTIEAMNWLPVWTPEEMFAFDAHIRDSECLVLQWYGGMDETYFRVGNEGTIRLHWETFDAITNSSRKLDFVRSCHHRQLSVQEKLNLTRAAIESILNRARSDAKIFLLGQTLQGQQPSLQNRGYGEYEVGKRKSFNSLMQEICSQDDKVTFIDPDRFVKPDWVYDGWHFTRQAYLEIANWIGGALDLNSLQKK